MRELELAGLPSFEPIRRSGARGRAPFTLSRTAFVVSVAVHVVAGYALSRQVWPGAPPQQTPIGEFFLFELPRPRPPDTTPASPPEPPAPEVREEAPPSPPPPPRAAEAVEQPRGVVEPSAETEPAPATSPTPVPLGADFEEARRRAAQEIVTERAASEYLTFSIDDVAPPRAGPEPKPKRSIFDGGPSFGGRSAMQPGQQRTRFGRKLADLCNALTGGIGVAFQGFGLFSACASPDDGPSGLFPEVRPAYLDMLPECVDTRDTAPALALEAPFPTIKCRMVRQEDPGE